ncbi:aminotransferase class V-fold PLP-dependent enzyme [Knoellia sp. DB2414S]|uniref:Aminotransferase class V-fold PLP-dependent enzyme n=2 Tax=Knoellia koreensis TaxID=2730921 RepID=A0A849HDT2_9MICO|nr:aminotransferase class V-fold PLP-dependent enzyme [Knoellia sp. DB2414S]NNM45269.1 aminotransferase class V-fold PLP-dependent enzyme [Knoellia sp. DB2414S]
MHPLARQTLQAALGTGWADPRRLHREGRTARGLLDQARAVIADGLGVSPAEVGFAPDGPTAVRWGIEGLRYAGRRRGARTVASAVEHSAVLLPGRHEAAQTGNPDDFATVPVDATGRVDLEAWRRSVAVPGTVAVALQHANGEVGTVQPLEEAHEAARAAGVPMAVDAQASLGRVAAPAAYDVLAGDAQSWGGPGGLGVLVVRSGTRWLRPGPADPDHALHGPGGHLPWVPLALAAAEAWQQTEASRAEDARAAFALVESIRAAAGTVGDVDVVGDPVERLPHVVTFSALYADGESLVGEFDRQGFSIGSGSACTASTLEPSHVLAAMGALTHGNVRVTLPVAAVAPEREAWVRDFVTQLAPAVERVRAQIGAPRP